MLETHPFGDFIPKNIKYLILGSFISNKAVQDPIYAWYYGNKINHFWPTIEQVYGVKLPDRKSKENLLTKLKIGMGDIIYQCERGKGNSSDTNLINIVYNPNLEKILQENKIEKIFFSSKFVEKQYRKNFKNLIEEFPKIEMITLPSPSPRYAAMSKEEKIQKYKKLLPVNY